MHTVIVAKFIKSMPQRRQEQTVERKKEGEGSKERERSTLRQWITKTGHQEAGGQREQCVTFSTIYNTSSINAKTEHNLL